MTRNYGVVKKQNIALGGLCKTQFNNMIYFTKTTEEILKQEELNNQGSYSGKDCPIPLSIIPNSMGINLASVHSISWSEQDDGQLVSLTINFLPE